MEARAEALTRVGLLPPIHIQGSQRAKVLEGAARSDPIGRGCDPDIPAAIK